MSTIYQRFSWLRLLTAILAAFIASMAWLVLYSEFFWFVGPYIGNVLLGFLGVLAGTFLFDGRHRFLGSVILFVGGVALDVFFEDSDDKVYPLSVFWVAFGGLMPVILWYWRRPRAPLGSEFETPINHPVAGGPA